MSKKTLLLVQSMQSTIDRLERELAEAKARAVIPDGWVAVPEELTLAMMVAIQDEIGSRTAHFIWHAALDARPELPKGALYNLPPVDDLAQAIRQIDGNNSLGAGALAEKIIENFATQPKGESNVE